MSTSTGTVTAVGVPRGRGARWEEDDVPRPPLQDVSRMDRTLLHRADLGEVFVTDARRLGERTYEVCAQLPRSHSYYTDHPRRVDGADPLLLLECCRQAETLVAHRFLAVPPGTHFILRSWDLVLERPCPAPTTGPPARLEMRVGVREERRLAGLLRSAVLDVRIRQVDDDGAATDLGALSMEVSYAGADTYRALRTAGGRAPVSSDSLLGRPVAAPLDPAWFARSRPENVLLSRIEPDERGLRALLRLPVTNTSMFDHLQDHVPAMVLTDAARQLALFALAEDHGISSQHTLLSGATGRFGQYVELDEPVWLLLRSVAVPLRTEDGPISIVTVEVDQGGRIPATLGLSFTTYPGAMAARPRTVGGGAR